MKKITHNFHEVERVEDLLVADCLTRKFLFKNMDFPIVPREINVDIVENFVKMFNSNRKIFVLGLNSWKKKPVVILVDGNLETVAEYITTK